MPRQKLSEYRVKQIIAQALGLPYLGWPIDCDQPLEPQISELLASNTVFVVKVDEGVKGRFKKGLVLLDVNASDLGQALQSLSSKGFRHLIVEPYAQHEPIEERYFCIMSQRSGLTISYSSHGGVDIESHMQEVESIYIAKDNEPDWENLANRTGMTIEQLKILTALFIRDYFVLLEINPYLAKPDNLQILDAAVEIDDTADYFVNDWSPEDFRAHSIQALTAEEKTVSELDANSPASLKLSMLEPNGSIFLLLSGGGASVVVADEIYNQGYGKQLANYGEYSGNPNSEETYKYTQALLSLLLKSSAPKKVLFIGGAVANFTDIAKTFAGVRQAISEVKDELEKQGVKIFVRRGGPNQEVGLSQMKDLLSQNKLLGAVHGPDVPLTTAVSEALQEVGHE